MFNKKLLYIFFIFLLFQIIFSFYYSSEIVSQNQILNKNLGVLDKLKKDNKLLEQQLSKNSSIDEIAKFAKEKNYQFIKKKISP